MKTVVAVSPYQHPNSINFKNGAFEAWKEIGGKIANDHYPLRLFHKLIFNHQLPSIRHHKKEARLRFVEPVSLNFDTYPDYIKYEIIPLVTSSQNAELMKQVFPHLNILFITEGIDTELYDKGKELIDRKIDLLEYGRRNNKVFKVELPPKINHLYSKKGERLFSTNVKLFQALADTRITVNFPRCDTQPSIAGNIETLTQRYWESMLSRIVIIGRAPKELIDLIGYNPVIEVDNILHHIEDYQELVDKNRDTALKMGSWKLRMQQIQEWLKSVNYQI